MRIAANTPGAPPPAGTYSQAIRVGRLAFLAGQTPRTESGERLNDAPFADQAHQVLRNLEAVANSMGASLGDAVKVNVFLVDPTRSREFDEIYRKFVGSPPPARTLTQSDLPGFVIEVDAIIELPAAPDDATHRTASSPD